MPYGVGANQTSSTGRIEVRRIQARSERTVRQSASERYAQIGPLLDQKLSYSEIGRRLGLNHATIMYHATQMGRR